jgi:hypothetical protein
MAPVDLHTPTPTPRPAFDPLGYWWTACGGLQAMREFHAAPEAEAWTVIERNPVLLLPEVVDAAEQIFGATRAIAGLREMHQALRGSPAYGPYHRLLASALLAERRGQRQLNLERALAVIQEVRRISAGPSDDAIERAILDGLAALKPRPAPTPALMDTVFLDERDLAGLRRAKDQRDTNPNPSDRAFTTQRGLATGAVTWLGEPGDPVYSVIDARWVFASTKAAKAYIDSPGTQLLSRDSLEASALLQIADGAHAWGGTPAGRGRQVLLFRVGRVVARLDVGEGPRAAAELQRLKRQQLLPYAELAVQRIRLALAQYWLGVGRGMEAAQAMQQAQPRKAEALLVQYPVLLLPEFPTAMASLGHTYAAAADRLAVLQGTSRTNWQQYRDNLRGLVRNLLEDPSGEPRVNADAALRLVSAQRRLDADPSWTELEAECSAQADGAGRPPAEPRE